MVRITDLQLAWRVHFEAWMRFSVARSGGCFFETLQVPSIEYYKPRKCLINERGARVRFTAESIPCLRFPSDPAKYLKQFSHDRWAEKWACCCRDRYCKPLCSLHVCTVYTGIFCHMKTGDANRLPFRYDGVPSLHAFTIPGLESWIASTLTWSFSYKMSVFRWRSNDLYYLRSRDNLSVTLCYRNVIYLNHEGTFLLLQHLVVGKQLNPSKQKSNTEIDKPLIYFLPFWRLPFALFIFWSFSFLFFSSLSLSNHDADDT